MEVIVIDYGSNDGTPAIVEKWVEQYRDLRLKLIREGVRRGKGVEELMHRSLHYTHYL